MNNFITSIKSSLVGLIGGGAISLDALIQQGLAHGWPQALLGIVVIILGALINENPTAKVVAADILPIVSSLTADSTNPTMEDVHKVIAALTTNPAITVNATPPAISSK